MHLESLELMAMEFHQLRHMHWGHCMYALIRGMRSHNRPSDLPHSNMTEPKLMLAFPTLVSAIHHLNGCQNLQNLGLQDPSLGGEGEVLATQDALCTVVWSKDRDSPKTPFVNQRNSTNMHWPQCIPGPRLDQFIFDQRPFGALIGL